MVIVVIEKNFTELQTELKSLDNILQFLALSEGPLPRKLPPFMDDSGEGFSDTSLRGRLELTKELLKRAGY